MVIVVIAAALLSKLSYPNTAAAKTQTLKYGITLIHTELLATICVTVTIFSLFSSSLFLCYHIIIAIILATTGATRAFANIHARLGQTLPLWVRPPRVDRPTGEHS